MLWVVVWGCGSRTGVDPGRPPRDAEAPDGGVLDGGGRDASTDGGLDAGVAFDAGTSCRFGPLRDASGALVPPTFLELPRETVTDVQLVAYDAGFYVLAEVNRQGAAYARFDDSFTPTLEVHPGRFRSPGGLARHGPTSSRSTLCNGGYVVRPDDERFGFVYSVPCLGFVSEGDLAMAWLPAATGAQVDTLALRPTTEEVIASRTVPTPFPTEVLGALFDAERERAVFLVGEVRDALSTDRLYFVSATAPVESVALDTPDAFRRLVDLARFDGGAFAAVDVAGTPSLHVLDAAGALLDVRVASAALFASVGGVSEADLVAFEDRGLVYAEGVLVDFAPEGASLVFDERARPDLPGLPRGFDVARHGTHLVTATGFRVGEDDSAIELRHYTCE